MNKCDNSRYIRLDESHRREVEYSVRERDREFALDSGEMESIEMPRLPMELPEIGLPPIRRYWDSINRHNRELDGWERKQHKARDKRRKRCRCDAYKFPHRPGGGLCRYPDPPAVRWQDAQAAEIAERVAEFRRRNGEPTPAQMADLIALTTKPYRPYRK
jgi:Zn-finger nucleic acid-binding protein